MTPDDIKSARLLAGLGRREFARRVGVSDVCVWKWETGKNQPTDEHWRAIEQVLRAKAAYDQTCKDTLARSAVYAWEAGRRNPGPKHLAKLAEVLGLEIADLLPRIQPDLGANQ